MGLIKRAADLAYTFRFIRMMAMDWKDWDAYKLGIIDENGKRLRDVKLDSDEKKTQDWAYITKNWEDINFNGKNNKKSYLHTTTTYDQEKNQATSIKEIRKK